jgi:putative transposase
MLPVHLLARVPPRVSISDYMVRIEDRTALFVLNKFPNLKQEPYWDTLLFSEPRSIGLIQLAWIRKYVKYQETKERREQEQLPLFQKTISYNPNPLPLQVARQIIPFQGL